MVLVTNPIIGDLIKQLGRERCSVATLIKPGMDPRRFTIGEEEREAIARAEVLFYSGLGLENKNIMKVLDEFKKANKKTFAITKGIDPNKLIKINEKEFNPHFWFSIALWKDAAKYATDTLIALDKNFTSHYSNQYEKYLQELTLLEEEVKNAINEIAPEKRFLITVHDAFAYFSQDYGLQSLSLKTHSTSQASFARTENLANFIVKNEIPAVFLATSTPKKELLPLQRNVFDKGNVLIIGGKLFANTLSVEENNDTYVKMFKKNVEKMVFGLTQ